MPLKPTHRKALVEILETGEFETPEDMAKALVDTLDELRAGDTTFIVVRELPYGDSKAAFYGYGPYSTRNAAAKAIERGVAGIPGDGKVAIVPLYSPRRVSDKLAEVDSVGDDHPRHHFARVRERAGVA